MTQESLSSLSEAHREALGVILQRLQELLQHAQGAESQAQDGEQRASEIQQDWQRVERVVVGQVDALAADAQEAQAREQRHLDQQILVPLEAEILDYEKRSRIELDARHQQLRVARQQGGWTDRLAGEDAELQQKRQSLAELVKYAATDARQFLAAAEGMLAGAKKSLEDSRGQ